MPITRPTFAGSDVLASIALRLHTLFADHAMTRADVSTVILEVEGREASGERLRRHLDEGVASLVRCGVIEPAAEERFRVTNRAAGFASERFAQIEREIEREAARMAADLEFETVDEPAKVDEAAEADPWAIDRTSRTFLEDLLRDADLPPDLMELIVQRYAATGRVRMSEDGRRYVIHL